MRTIACLLAFPAIVLGGCNEPVRQSDAPVPSFQPSSAFTLVSTIAFVSTRDDPTGNPLLAAEIYLMDGDVTAVNGGNPRRVTHNNDGDGFPALKPDGKGIVFDSNRLRAEGDPLNTSDLFVMNTDGTEPTWVTRGSSATWSPDGKLIAFHASASGTAKPIKADPGAATFDSDIFVANLDDLLQGVSGRKNITNSPEWIDDDPDWSPVDDRIVFTRHAVTDNHQNSTTAEIWVTDAAGAAPVRLTGNSYEERAPSWSPDGTRIVYSCRRGGSDFEICVINAAEAPDETKVQQLTDNAVGDLTPTFSPDGEKILFHRQEGPGLFELWTLSPDGRGGWTQEQLTNTDGANLLANWGELRVRAQ
jgi:Tol biopolymer transport system component